MPGIDSYTKIILHGDENPLVDSSYSPHTLTLNNGIGRSSSQSKFGGYSISFDGINQSIAVADSNDWYFGSGDFTVDCWVYFTAFTNSISFISSQWGDGSLGEKAHQFFYDPTAQRLLFTLGQGSTHTDNYVSWTASTGQWYHLAAVRNVNDFKFFVNGSQQGSTNDVTGVSVYDSTTPLRIGVYEAASGIDTDSYIDGYIEEYRISKGVARWTSNFTVPSEAYSISSIDYESTSNIVFASNDISLLKPVEFSSSSNIVTETQSALSNSIDFNSSSDIVLETNDIIGNSQRFFNVNNTIEVLSNSSLSNAENGFMIVSSAVSTSIKTSEINLSKVVILNTLVNIDIELNTNDIEIDFLYLTDLFKIVFDKEDLDYTFELVK